MPPGPRYLLKGLPPLAGQDPAVLVLGSFPGSRSLETGQYYANPQNHFWEIIQSITGIDPTLPYGTRILLLEHCHIALWDVVGSCRRSGSADSRIREPMYNPIGGFLESNPSIRLIACNGMASARHAARLELPDPVRFITLPSTSPANTQFSLKEKIRRWSVLKDFLKINQDGFTVRA